MTIFVQCVIPIIIAAFITIYSAKNNVVFIVFKNVPILGQSVKAANWFFLFIIFLLSFLLSFGGIYYVFTFIPTPAPSSPISPATPQPTPANNDDDAVPSVSTQLATNLQQIEQIHLSAETMLAAVYGRLDSIEKLLQSPGALPPQFRDLVKSADAELNGVLQYLQESLAAIDRNMPSFERGKTTLSTEIFQRWLKAKDRQAQMGKRMEELRKRLLSYPPPPDNEQQLKDSALEFVRKYYENLHRADAHAVVEMWLPDYRESTLPAKVKDCAWAKITCSRIIEIDLPNASVSVDVTVKNKSLKKAKRYVLTFILRRMDDDWKLYMQKGKEKRTDITNPTCLAD